MTHRNVADHLGALVTTGIYDVAMIENEFTRYGFVYLRESDELQYSDRSVILGARPAQEARDEVARDGGGFVDARADDALLVDALQISQAVHLLVTGTPPPSLGYTNRTLGYRADVKSLTKWFRRN